MGKDTLNKKKTLIQREDYMHICYIVIIVSLLIPLVSISNEEIKNSTLLVDFSNILSSKLKTIENIAIVSSSVNLYWKTKFILTWSFFTGFFVFIMMLYFYGKAYLFSLGYIKKCKKKHMICTIYEKGTDLDLYDFNLLIIFILASLDFFYFGYFFTIEDRYTYSIFFKKNIPIFIFASLMSLLFSIYAYVTLELFVQLKKLFGNKTFS